MNADSSTSDCRSRDCKFEFQLDHISVMEIDHETTYAVILSLWAVVSYWIKYVHKHWLKIMLRLQQLSLTITTLWAYSADYRLTIFFLFFPEHRQIDSIFLIFPRTKETICMKCQDLLISTCFCY